MTTETQLSLEDVQFEDIPHSTMIDTVVDEPSSPRPISTSSPSPPISSASSASTLASIPFIGAQLNSLFSVDAYKRYFNVSTTSVLSRLMKSATGRQFYDEIEQQPDLYGPLWIATTTIFLLAATSNLLRLMQLDSDNLQIWHYDFELFTHAATIFYSMISVVPATMWVIMGYFQLSVSLPLLISIYGYSYTPLLPITILCVAVQAEVLIWLALALYFGLSSAFLLRNFTLLSQTLDNTDAVIQRRKRYGYMSVIGINLLLTVVVKYSFY